MRQEVSYSQVRLGGQWKRIDCFLTVRIRSLIHYGQSFVLAFGIGDRLVGCDSIFLKTLAPFDRRHLSKRVFGRIRPSDCVSFGLEAVVGLLIESATEIK